MKHQDREFIGGNVATLSSRSSAFPQSPFWLSTALFVWYLIAYVLLPVPGVRSGLDESWRAFLTWAFEHHKQFGTDVIFTYGPWGFLLEPRGTIGIYPWQVLGRLVLAIAASSGIALLGVSWIRSALLRWIWAATIVFLAEPAELIPVLLFLTTIPSSVELRKKRPVLILVAFAAGLAACTKFISLLLVAPLIPLMLLRKGLATVASTTVASFFLFWLLARQGVPNIPAFIKESAELSTGYGSAMVAGRPWIELPLALLVCSLPLLQLAGQILPPANPENVVRLGWLSVCEFLVFRHALIRSDPFHYYMSFLTIGLPIVVLLAPLAGGLSRVMPWGWQSAYTILLLGALIVALSSARKAVVERSTLFMESFRRYPAYAREISSPRKRGRAIPADTGTVDVFPSELSYAIQKGLLLRNRPVIQSYSAYTRDLCEKNAAFLEGRSAPGKIYFHFGAVDGRYPTMEDSLAWRSLMTHYAPFSVVDEYLVLKHRERPVDYELKPIMDRGIRTDEMLEIPDVPGGLVWAELQVSRTAAGRLLDLFYRSEKLGMQAETDTRIMNFTLLDETAAGGFLLSPYVSTGVSMMDVFQAESDRFNSEKVRRILIRRRRVASLGFGRNVRVRLYALAMNTPPQDVPGSLVEDLGRTMRAERPVGSIPFSPELTLDGGEVRLVVGSPSSGWIPLEGGKSLRVRYGIDGKRSPCSGDVRFRISAGPGTPGEKVLLWEEAHRSESGKDWSAESTVKLPSAAGWRSLYFETRSAERSCGAEGAYWANLRIDSSTGVPEMPLIR